MQAKPSRPFREKGREKREKVEKRKKFSLSHVQKKKVSSQPDLSRMF